MLSPGQSSPVFLLSAVPVMTALAARLFFSAANANCTRVFAMPSGTALPDLPPRAPTPPSQASVALSPTCRISTRTRRRTAAAAGAVHPAVDYAFALGRVSWASSSRVGPPPRVPLPRLPLTAAPSACRAPMPVPTVPMSHFTVAHRTFLY